ncbi:MAG: hypothetical protein ACO1O3_05005 [Sphingobium sp.]
MFRRALSLVLLLAVLVAGSGAPALAHIHQGLGAHAFEHDGGDAAEAEDKSDAPKPRPGDQPSHVGHHHHCGADIAVDCVDAADTGLSARTALMPAISPTLPSRALAPPLQPPAA